MGPMGQGQGYGYDTIARKMAQDASAAMDFNLASLTALVESLRPGFGTAAVPALSLGASAQVTVTLSKDMGTTSFQPLPVLLGSATLLGALQVGGVVSQTATQVVVLVRAPLVAVAVGAVLQVLAFRTS